MSEQKTNLSGRHGITDNASSEVAEVGKTLIQGIAPAEKGWILGFIVVVAIIVLSDMWVNLQTLKSTQARGEQTQAYFEMVENNRAAQGDQMAQVFADQVRRSQEVIRDLANAVARDSERAGMAALSAIDKQSDSLASKPPEPSTARPRSRPDPETQP